MKNNCLVLMWPIKIAQTVLFHCNICTNVLEPQVGDIGLYGPLVFKYSFYIPFAYSFEIVIARGIKIISNITTHGSNLVRYVQNDKKYLPIGKENVSVCPLESAGRDCLPNGPFQKNTK